MTPRQVDVAFVLEAVEGVGALYAIDPRRRAAAYFDFAIEVKRDGRVVAQAHYALLRVITYEDCARVLWFHTTAPSTIADALSPLHLTASEREEARARVPPPVAQAPFVETRTLGPRSILVVSADDDVLNAVRESKDREPSAARWTVAPEIAGAVRLATEQPFDAILCDARLAFGTNALLARLPSEVATRVLVLAAPSEVANARWRLQGMDRILTKPLEAWVLRERLLGPGAAVLRHAHRALSVTADDRPRRRVPAPEPSAPIRVLLVDAGDDVHEALRSCFREETRTVSHLDPEKAADEALSTPFHVLVCGANAALHRRSFLDAVGREDPAGADGALVVAPARDVPYTMHKLRQMGRTNTVLPIPLDDASLRREILRRHPALAARGALAELSDTYAPSFPRVRFRRPAVLVVDDDPTTKILFAASDPHWRADVALATSVVQAFEHVVSRPVDLLLVSATMRSDGGEPLYRVLWRLDGELKPRSVLIAAAETIQACGPQRRSARVIERPVTRDAIRRAIEAHRTNARSPRSSGGPTGA